MTPKEFSEWLDVLAKCEVDEDGNSESADLAWRLMLAKVNAFEMRIGEESTAEIVMGAVRAASFWIALGSVLVAYICMGGELP